MSLEASNVSRKYTGAVSMLKATFIHHYGVTYYDECDQQSFEEYNNKWKNVYACPKNN